MASAEYKRAKYREARADPVAFARLQQKQARNYRQKKEADPSFLAEQAEKRRLKRYHSEALVKLRCRQATHRAIRAGVLVKQPWEVCGEVKVDAHHDDYSQPLAIRWLCGKHHAEHHGHLWCEQNGVRLAALSTSAKETGQ